MEVNIQTIEPATHLIEVQGEMDLYNSHQLKELIVDLLEKDTNPFIVDLGKLNYIDSSGISVLLFIFTQTKKRGRGLWFVNVQGSVRKVIKLTSLLGFLPIADSLDEAKSNLS